MPEVYHIDLSNKFWKKATTGIACVSSDNKRHVGCALSMQLKKGINKHLTDMKFKKGRAKLYAICIYYLITENISGINKLVICNDEEFKSVRMYLRYMLGKGIKMEIISITDYRKELGRNIKSLADNFARHYAKRGLNELKQSRGLRLNVIKINYAMINTKWEELKDVSE